MFCDFCVQLHLYELSSVFGDCEQEVTGTQFLSAVYVPQILFSDLPVLPTMHIKRVENVKRKRQRHQKM